MHPKSILNIFSPKGAAQAVARRAVSILMISSVALALVALAAYMQIKPVNELVGAIVPAQAEASGPYPETLSHIHPADRKFFTPGYGAQPVTSRQAEMLPATKIEPYPLAAYYQSEWGRTLRSGLPIVENKTDPDQDIGLMEFFTVPE